MDDLLACKAVSRELGTGPLPGPVAALIGAEFTTARDLWPSQPRRPEPAMVAAADDVLRT